MTAADFDLSPADLGDALQRWAAGHLPTMAAVDLLIGHEHWLTRLPFLRRVSVDDTMSRLVATPHWAELCDLITGRADDSDAPLYDSDSEQSMLAIACSLAGGLELDLGNALTSLDRANLRLVADAVLAVDGAR